MSTWQERLAQEREKSEMKVTKVPINKIGGPWALLTSLAGALISILREDRKFFSVLGILVGNAKREVPEWGQPMFKEEGVGVYVLITNELRERFVVAIKQEPGNPEDKKHILLACPLQTSLGNLEQAHGGKLPPRAELYRSAEWRRTLLADAWKDGGRFLSSLNKVGVVLASEEQFEGFASALLPNEVVMTRAELKEAYLAGECNCYLREAIGLALL